jgi:CHAT domain-containing protein
MTNGKAVVWILAKGRQFDQVVLAPQDELGKRIGLLGKERSLEAWKAASGALFEELVAPVLERLPAGTKHLVVIPDSGLFGLPFRALWDRASGRYLDERYLLSLAPSVRLYLEAGQNRPAATAPATLPVLSLGFSAFSPVLGLEPLPRAAEEAASVGEAYGGPGSNDCQVGDWVSFLRCAPRAGILHLATHAQAGSGGDKSWLAFGKETISLDRLWEELPDLSNRPLVVLSACQSVAAGRGDGLGGLARPFLASGARAVVGTLWKIHDEDAADLFPAFHRAYRDTGNAAEALSLSREGLRSWQERPWVWGAVEVVNGGG